MNTTWVVAKKEILDARRNKLFIIILAMLLLLTLVSIVLSTYQVRASMDGYNQSISFLKSLGKANFPDPPKLNPLAASKSFVNYIGMLGALLAIVLGNYSVVKERRNGTMRLILSRQIFRDRLLNGKLLGNLILLAAICFGMFVVTMLSVLLVGKITLSGDDIFRLLLFFLMAFLYMVFFLVLSITVAVATDNGNKALLITVIIWLVLSFVFPQIGDTMDMDNQLPGGFFAQMGITKDAQTQILSHFKFYETLRDGIEEASPVKHFERAGFALLNVKPGFDTYSPLGVVAIKWVDLIGLTIPSIILWLIAYMVFHKREDIF